MPRFSVIIPTYNRAGLITRCLESVQKQTCKGVEIIVVDDGSTDDTRQVIERLADQDPRIRYLYQENTGACEARNLGARRATGEWLTFLDSDDEASCEWLTRFQEPVRDDETAIVCCGITFIGTAGEVLRERLPSDRGPRKPVLSGLFRSGTFAIRRSVFWEVGGYDSRLAANQHSELRCRLAKEARRQGWHITCLPESLIHAHDHEGPKIRKNDRAVLESADFILRTHGDLLRENSVTYANWAAACAGAAARLGHYHTSRTWFWQATLAQPRNVRNLLRFLVACCPGLRTYVWGRNGEA